MSGLNSFFSTVFTAAAFIATAYFTQGMSLAYQMAATFAVSVVASRIFAPNVPQAQQNNVRQQVPPDPTAGIPLVYGDAYTGGRFADAVLTTDQKSMYYVLVISNISPNGVFTFDFTKFYYQDQIITFDTSDPTKVVSLTDGAGNVDTSIADHLYIHCYTSSATGTITPANGTAMPYDVISTANGAPSGQEWATTNRQMNGLAFAIVQLVYNNNSPGTTSLQPVTFHVSHYLNGTGCAKPGDVWYDYITNSVYGGAVDPSFVSSASATALNTYSDELITYTPSGGGTSTTPRYRFNGVLDTGQTVLANIDIMMTCCDSWQSYQAATGLWSVSINQTISPSFSFDDNNIIGSISTGELDITQMVNQIEAKFNDSTNRDQPGYVNLQTPANLLYQNEPVNKFTVSYDLINSSVTAQYLANRTLEQNRLDLIISFATNYTGIQVNAGDVVTVTNSYYGWTNKQFRVMQVKEASLPDGTLGASLQLIDYDANVYATGDITQYTPTPNSGLASPTYFSALAAPTISAHRETATIPNFDVQVYVPMVGRVTTGTLFYTTVSTPSLSDWQTWATYTNTSNQPVLNNTYFTFADVVLPAATYYFAYTASNEKTSTPLSPISTAFVWTPVGISGASGASGASGYSGFSGLSGVSGYSGLSGYSGIGSTGLTGLAAITAYKLQSQTLTPPTYSTPTSGATAPSGWSLTAPTATVGQVVWYLMGQYNSNSSSYGGVPANSTAWTGPVAASIFQDIESDNWTGGTPPTTGPFAPIASPGYYIQKNTGNMYLNSIYGQGVARFDGQNTASGISVSGYAAVVGNLSNIQNYGLYGTANAAGNSAGVFGYNSNTSSYYSYGVFGQNSNPYSPAIYGYNYGGGTGIQGVSNSSGIGVYGNSSSGSGVEGDSVYGAGVKGVSISGNGVQGSGTYGVYSTTAFGTSSTAFVNNLYAQYTQNLVGQASGTLLYFYTGPTTGASTATFNPANKPGLTSGSNTWIEVIINGSSYQIPVWAS